MERADSAPILVLSPHLDDAVLSAWRVIAGGGDALVVNVFAGVPSPGPPPRWDRLAGAVDRRSHMEARLEEDRAALALADCPAVYLPFLDRHYRDGGPSPQEIAAAVARAVPAASALYAPAGIGGHADHLLVREAAVDLAGRAGVPLRLYAELPYAVRFGWPSWVTASPRGPGEPAAFDWHEWLGKVPLLSAAAEPHAHRLDDGQMSAKLAAMKRYRTQFELLNQGAIGLLEHPGVLPWEVVWSVDLSADG